jgi:hypothetical protein
MSPGIAAVGGCGVGMSNSARRRDSDLPERGGRRTVIRLPADKTAIKLSKEKIII